MPPRPLHRWKSFWLGLFVLIFLGWAWVRSMHHMDDIHYKPSTSSITWGAGTDSGAVSLGWRDDPFTPDGLGFSYYRPNWAWGSIWFPDAILLDEGPDEGWQDVRIAHWFLILLFLVPWAGFLVWRVRRLRRFREMQPSVEDGTLP